MKHTIEKIKKIAFKKGETVVVISGNDKDLVAPKKVLQVLRSQNRIVLEGVNMVTKHTKPTSQNPEGGIVKVEAPIHVSNVMFWDATSKSPSRISRERDENGKLKRVLKKSNKSI